ncbi:MAG: DedA family protein [Acidimicrobiales bacterium]
MISQLVDVALRLHGLVAYALVGTLAFGEAAVMLGFVLPGETAVILGGVLASQHRVSLGVMMAVAILSAIAGDSVGYEVGKKLGPRLIKTRLFLRPRPARAVATTQGYIRRFGGRAVFIGRFTALLRAMVPGMAGMSGISYFRFLAFNAAGGIIWAGGYTLIGYLVGASYKKAEKIAGSASAGLLGLIVLVVILNFIRNKRKEKRLEQSYGGKAESAEQAGALAPTPPAVSEPAPARGGDEGPPGPPARP